MNESCPEEKPCSDHYFVRLGFVKRGIIILIAGFVAAIVLSLFLPFYLSLPFIAASRIWQIIDAYKLYNKISTRVVRE
jgi:hypothetical protein